MPTLTLSGTLYVASDIHLGPSIPLTNQLFYQFLQKASNEADALLLPGDIFNVWFGDDFALTSQEPWLQETLVTLKKCAQKIPVYFIHGNRDFLIGKTFCQQVGMHLLPEQCLLKTEAGTIFISHGDELCTQDKSYMRLRCILRCSLVQHLFLHLPLSWRSAIAQFLRHRSHSIQQQQDKAYHQHYDIALEALETILQQYPDIQYIIHGHTHQEAIHTIPNHPNKKRFVLSDWDIDHAQRQGYLCIKKEGLAFHKMPIPSSIDTLTP